MPLIKPMVETPPSATALLSLLQLASPALPVGAYSYSEGIETLVHQGQISHADALAQWLTEELERGAIRLEAAVMMRAYRAWQQQDSASLVTWNDWLSAVRDGEELRNQSWQMGRSLLRLVGDLEPAGLARTP
jgi:urease accessory protein